MNRMQFLKTALRVAAAGIGFAALFANGAMAGEAAIAVAANFTAPAKELAGLYQAGSGHTVLLSFGASGQFFAQISQGAPFDAFLSADNERTQKAVQDGLAVPGSEFTYAIGKLVLWSADPGLVDNNGLVLKKDSFAKLAIANPKLAPYGAAAVETLKALGLYAAVENKIVMGENIGQTYQFVSTENADIGFVAYSQVVGQNGGSLWIVPEKLHAPILQNAVLLKHGEANVAAKGFIAFLKGLQAAAIIRRYGYSLPVGK